MPGEQISLDSHEIFSNIDKNVIISFLKLIRDKYSVVDEANYFLESRTGASGVNIALVNQRDFTSHLCTLLNNKKLLPEEQYAQLNSAEEHLRRAIIESYQRSVNIKIISINELIKEYKKRVIPNINKSKELAGAPDWLHISKKLNEIRDLRNIGRKSKSRNQWDEIWENGVKAFIDAFDQADNLEIELENYLAKAPERLLWKPIALSLIVITITLTVWLIIISSQA
jgi:hypothetical protein